MTTLLVGFDSAWTATNSGAIAGVLVREDGWLLELGEPTSVNFVDAERAILRWQEEYAPTLTTVLIDQPTIVKNESGQRPVEQIVSSVVGARYGGMQPAYTAKQDMFGKAAPVWSFQDRFGGAADPLVPSTGTRVIETYPVLMLISLGWTLPDARPGGRLPKYNPDRATFSLSDWRHVCLRARDALRGSDMLQTSQWLDRAAELAVPKKPDQDRVDAALCLLAARHVASGRDCLMIGDQETGYIIVPNGGVSLKHELELRCRKTRRVPSNWVRVFRDLSLQSLTVSLMTPPNIELEPTARS